MLRIYADSACSIKKEELKNYNIKIIPLKILFNDKEYLDTEITFDEFYDLLVNKKIFPKTSLPDLTRFEDEINEATKNGDDVIIVTLSSAISGTYNAVRLMFEDNPKVKIIDSLGAVGIERLIIEEIIKNQDKPVDEIISKVNALIPRIKLMAVPETLTYLLRGGRLSKKEWLIGSILQIKPIIGFVDGKVKVVEKTRGTKKAMRLIIEKITEDIDMNYPVIVPYTENKENAQELVNMLPEEIKNKISVYDNLASSIAAHWGPGAYGLIYVSSKA